VDIYWKEYQPILRVRPGITDVASLKYRDEATVLSRASDPEMHYLHVILPEKIRLAKDYVENASFLCDMRLIFLTLVCLIYRETKVEILWASTFRA
jgi:lipopolysaccharide/colanic/teichoic acid biosynthesis glycosyltransferase